MKPIENPYGAEGGCFFCGPKNPIGLKLRFFETDQEPKELVCRWTPSAHYRGLGGVLHGGIQSGLFDEIMGWTTFYLMDSSAVTSDLHIAFQRPVFIGEELEVRCRIKEVRGRRVQMEAEIKNPAGEICTTASGAYILMDRERFQELMGPSD